MSDNIKNCPFCGCSVSVERVPLKHYKGCVIFEIKCLNCGCERSLIKNDSIYRTEEEARANAIAQWNERPATAAVPQEMSAVEYFKEKARMKATLLEECQKRLQCREPSCHKCQWSYRDRVPDGNLERENPQQAVAIVERWAREHPKENDE